MSTIRHLLYVSELEAPLAWLFDCIWNTGLHLRHTVCVPKSIKHVNICIYICKDNSFNDFRIIESFREEKTFKIISSNYHLTLPSPPLNHVPKCHIHMSLKHLQLRGHHHFPGQPMSILKNRCGMLLQVCWMVSFYLLYFTLCFSCISL